MIATTFTTFVGADFDIACPNENMIYWLDIVQGLSQACRYGCQAPVFYSVAQHSVLVALDLRSQMLPPEVQWEGLLHDAEEAYPPGDLVRPLKYMPEAREVLAIQRKVKHLIESKYGLAHVKSDQVDAADKKDDSLARDCFRDIRAGAIQPEWAWSPEHARFMFHLCALMILGERPHSSRLMQGIESSIPNEVISLALSTGLSRGAWPMEKHFERDLASDLKRVFSRYGLDPDGPEFSQFIRALEQVQASKPSGGAS